MEDQLRLFLDQYNPQVEELVTWGSDLQLNVKSYHCAEVPPLKYVTSVRSIVLRDDTVLVMQDPDGSHILPGGRVEAGETLTQALERELREETGWIVNRPGYLGFKHFQHLTPKPAGYLYPYPDFLQVIYVSYADVFQPDAKEQHGYELGAAFVPIYDLSTISLAENERFYLKIALQMWEH